MGWLSSNKKRSFAEKLMKDIRAREEKENVDVIGKVSPKIQEKRAVEKAQAKIRQESATDLRNRRVNLCTTPAHKRTKHDTTCRSLPLK